MSEAHRRVWAAGVAKLVYPADPARATAKIVYYLPHLTDLPTEAFNPHSAEAVAMAERKMALPSFDEIARPLRAWWRDHKLPPPVIRGPGAPLLPLDWAWVAYWQKRRGENFAAFGESLGGKRHVASLIRQQSPAAWAHIAAEERA